MMKSPMENKNAIFQKRAKYFSVANGEEGSIMLVVLMVLLLLTLGGISASNLAVTESYIVRNTGIHKQNLQLAEMAALQGLREILTRNDPSDLVPGGAGAEVWFHNMSTWDNDPTVNDTGNDDNFPLTDNNSAAAAADLLMVRGETADAPLRYYFIGWRDAPNSSLRMTDFSLWRQGRVISIYDSERYGLASVELGVIKRF